MKSIAFVLSIILSISAYAKLDQSHSEWDAILKKYVVQKGDQTLFDYRGLKKSPAALNKYLKELSSVTPAQYKSFTSDQRLAFLINAYNAFTVKLIVDHYPVKSIKKIGSLFSSPWKNKFFTLLGEEQHLDGIEHGTIRKKFSEPRIHFAVNCASIGCPNLLPQAFTAENLETLLEEGSRTFLMDKSKNKLDVKKKTLYLSKIFDWYGGDFNKKFKSPAGFAMTFLTKDEEVIKAVKKGQYKIKYTDYDWDLNEIKR